MLALGGESWKLHTATRAYVLSLSPALEKALRTVRSEARLSLAACCSPVGSHAVSLRPSLNSLALGQRKKINK